ncbi:hypothetical protein D5W64_13180 [Salmonella enterica subsp. enterica serovar Saintpaul]|nr:hypothetical protein [Salmonella enterica subsp. enterica serovar Saintpaul]
MVIDKRLTTFLLVQQTQFIDMIRFFIEIEVIGLEAVNQ